MDETTYKPKIEKYIEINWKKIWSDTYYCVFIFLAIIIFTCFSIGLVMILDSQNLTMKIIGIILIFPLIMVFMAMFIALFVLLGYGVIYWCNRIKTKWITINERETQIEIL